MFKYKIIVLLIVCSLYGIFPQSITKADLEINEAPYTIQANFFAKLYGVDGKIVNGVLNGESNYQHDAPCSDGGRSCGIARIQKPTWNWMEDEYFEEWNEHLDYKSSHDQIKLLAYQISKGHGDNWTVYRCIKNGGKYSFYSSQNKRHYTIYCKV
jgi:hypothetical protein